MRGMLLLVVCVMTLALAANVHSADGLAYPRKVEFENGHVIMHAPQVTAWEDFVRIEGSVALEGHKTGSSETVYATARFTAVAVPDVDRRIVTMSDLVIDRVTFADGILASGDQKQMLQDAVPVAAREIPLDLVLSHLSEDVLASDSPGVKSDPPKIHVATTPTIIVMFQGEPVASPIVDIKLNFIVNTNWSLFTNEKQNRWYLLNGKEWLTAKKLDGEWSYLKKVPKDLKNLPFTANWNSVRTAAKAWSKPKDKQPPTVIVSIEPAELIVMDGEPDLVEAGSERLHYVSNTDSLLFREGEDWYYLVSGRWFTNTVLEGAWQSVPQLPDAFQEIPVDHAKADVRASVPGTMESRMAAFEAVLPSKTKVSMQNVPSVDVVYAGEPEFETIPNTGVSRATNTGYDVLRVLDTYYLCYEGAWYTSAKPDGPWLVAMEIPPTMYEIPPSSPSYHTTYVKIEETSPVSVTFAYTSGYYGTYVHYGVPVWGTGWYYPPYVYYPGYGYPIYYPYPYTYGSAAFYNPRTGVYGATSRYYGPYGGYAYTSAYNPRTGTYATAQSAWDNDEFAMEGQAYNPRTGRSFETERYYDADDGDWKTDSTFTGDRGAVDVTRHFDDDSGRLTLEGSRGGSGQITRNESGGGQNTNSTFQTADGRTITGEGRFEGGEGSTTLTGSEGGSGTIERSIDSGEVTREGSFERDGQTLDTETTRDGTGRRTTFEGSEGGRGVVDGGVGDRSFVAESGSGDLYAGRDGDVYKRTDDGWAKHSDGAWSPIEMPDRPDRDSANQSRSSFDRSSLDRNSISRDNINRQSRSSYDRNNLNRQHQARSQGMSQYRNRSSQFQSRGGGGRGRRR